MKLLNQTEVCRELNLPLYVVKHLRGEKVLKTRKAGREVLYTKKYVDLFKKQFNINEFFTVSEVKNMLEEIGVYDQFNIVMKLVMNKLDFSVTVKNLIAMNKLDVVRFGSTTYITKKSTIKTLTWLKELDEKLNPMPTSDELMPIKKKKPKFGKKKIKLKKQKGD